HARHGRLTSNAAVPGVRQRLRRRPGSDDRAERTTPGLTGCRGSLHVLRGEHGITETIFTLMKGPSSRAGMVPRPTHGSRTRWSTSRARGSEPVCLVETAQVAGCAWLFSFRGDPPDPATIRSQMSGPIAGCRPR